MTIRSKRLDGRNERILESELPILDSHFHLFDLPQNRYMIDEYLDDVSTGHNIVASIYCETQSFVRTDGPEWMKPLGEVEFANGIAAMTATGKYGDCKVAHGIIGHANLTFGSQIGELLDRCLSAAPERFRGVRQVTVEYPDDRPFKFIMSGRPPSGILENDEFVLGLAEVAKRNLVFDAAIFDPTLPQLTKIVDKFPDLTVVLNHMGTAVGVDMSDDERTEVFRRWTANLKDFAQRPNVHCKVGGMGMPHWGFGFEEREDVVSSFELAAAWRPFVETAIETFGTERCMMESNFPPDGRSSGYVPTWNAYKIITANASESEKLALYRDNAAKLYKLDI